MTKSSPRSWLTDEALTEAIKLGACNYLTRRKACERKAWQDRNRAVLAAGKTPGDLDLFERSQENLDAGIEEIKGMKV